MSSLYKDAGINFPVPSIKLDVIHKIEISQAKKLKKLQEGRNKKKVSFKANCLKELTIIDGKKEIKLLHPDEYNFVVIFNDKIVSYNGTLDASIKKIFRLLNGEVYSYPQELISFIKQQNLDKVKPNQNCSIINIIKIKIKILSCR